MLRSLTIPKTVARFNSHVTNRVSRPFAGVVRVSWS